MVKVKKNKAPIKRKGRYGTAGSVQKQTVSQNVKVNIYKPTRVPKDFKTKQLGRDGAGGAVPNIRALPSFSFHSNIQQPASLLYGERFGNARPVQISPFERMLAEQAVDGNRSLEVAQLKNSLESARLKKIQAEPILAPAKRGESEEDRFMARATASTDDNRPPFRISSVDEQGTLGVSFKSRVPDAEFVRQSRLKNLTTPEHVASLKLPPNTIRDTLRQAEAEAEGRELFSSPSLTTDRPPREQYFARDPEPTPLREETYGEPAEEPKEREHDLGEPEIPNKLAAYGADEPAEYEPERPPRRGPGAPIQFLDTEHKRGREYMREYRARRSQSTEK